MLTLFFDGLCEPVNPGGIACVGFVVYLDKDKIGEGSGFIGAGYLGDYTSNNVAEYRAVIEGLRWLLVHGYEGSELTVKGDSQLIIKQLRGEYQVKSKRLKPLHEETLKLLRKFKLMMLEWIPREENREADALSRQAYLRFLKEHPEALLIYGARSRRRKPGPPKFN